MSRQEVSSNPAVQHTIESDVLRVVISGLIGVREIATYAMTHIEDWSRCSRLVWDIRGMEFFEVSLDSLKGMSDEFADVNAARAGGRTAIVVKKRDDILGQMLVNLANSHDVPIEHRIFLSMQDALGWLNQDA